MKDRLRSESVLPEICTLHVFGKGIIIDNYEEAGFFSKPENVWNEEEMHKIIDAVKEEYERRMRDIHVAIYKIEGLTTGRCYIGQTINPKRREKEHFADSSNRLLRDAIHQGNENFKFDIIEWVKGSKAYPREKYWIDQYRDNSIIVLESQIQEYDSQISEESFVVYRVNSEKKAKCWMGMSNDPDQIINKHIEESSDNELKREIEEGCIEFLSDKLPKSEAINFMIDQIKRHQDWVVFNRSDPVSARYSNQLRIEVFCKHFNVSYEKVLEQPEKYQLLFDEFDTIKERLFQAKGKVTEGLFEPEMIPDMILRAFAVKYENIRKVAGALDFFDMLILSASILENNQDLHKEYQKKYKYVLVDEFQDISLADYRLIKLFPDNLFVVGDDDQAIYGFRGGDSEIMQNYGNKIDVTEFVVTRNYRSTAEIVNHSKALVEYNCPRIWKELQAENSANSRVETIESSLDTIETKLMTELLPVVTVCETHFKENTPKLIPFLMQELVVPQNIGILARNWYEVTPIQAYLIKAFKDQGFGVHWLGSGDEEKRKLKIQRGQKTIELSTIHSAKGKEWDKVILLVNTMSYSHKT